jgi:hypothetical protein
MKIFDCASNLLGINLILDICFVEVCLLGYTLYDDIMTKSKSAINWHGIGLKASALVGSVGMTE